MGSRVVWWITLGWSLITLFSAVGVRCSIDRSLSEGVMVIRGMWKTLADMP